MAKVKPYVKTDWIPSETAITRENMMNIENQIGEVTDALLLAKPEDRNEGSIAVRNANGEVEGDLAGNSASTSKFDKKKLLKVTGVVNGQVQFDGSEEGDKIEIATTLDKGYQQLLDQKLECFLNTKHMQGCPTLSVGQHCYVINDIVVDGSRLYEVIDYAGEVKLDNGLWARLIPRKTITGDLNDLMFALTEKILEGLKSLQDYVITAENGGNAEFLRGFIPADFRRTVEKLKSGDFSTSSDADKIKLINLSDEVTRAMSGNAPVRPEIGNGEIVSEKIANDAVNAFKVDFISIHGNLIEYSKNNFDGYINGTTGELVPTLGSFTKVTEFIPINPNTIYSSRVKEDMNLPDTLSAFYDINKNFIGRLSSNTTISFTTPGDAYYVRVVFTTKHESPYFYEGQDLGYRKPLKFTYSDVTKSEEQTFFLEVGNLLKKSKNFTRQYVSSVGVVTDLSTMFLTEFLPIEEDTLYTSVTKPTDNDTFSAFYDSNKKFIMRLPSDNTKTFKTPIGAAYVRISGFFESMPSAYFIKGTVENNVPYSVTLDEVSLKKPDNYTITDMVEAEGVINLAEYATILGYYPDANTGELVANENYAISEFIQINPNSVYTSKTCSTDNDFVSAFYDSNKKFITRLSHGNALTFTTPNNAYYVRVCRQLEVSKPYFYKGKDLGYLNSSFTFKGLRKETVDVKIPIPNLANNKPTDYAGYFDGATGNIVDNIGTRIADFLEIKPNTVYTSFTKNENADTYSAIFDKDKVFIKRINATSGVFVTPENAKYIRLCYLRDKSMLHFVEGEHQPSEVTPNYSFESNTYPLNIPSRFYGKTILFVGDSLTDHGRNNGYVKYVKEALGCEVLNAGVGSTAWNPSYQPRRGFNSGNLVDALIDRDFSVMEETVQEILATGQDKTEQMNILKNVDLDKLDYIVVAWGTNDVGQSTLNVTPYMEHFFSKLLTKHKNIKPIIIAPPFRGDNLDWNDSRGKVITEYILDFAKSKGIPALAMLYESPINNYTSEYYLHDKVHLSQHGYEMYGSKIAGFIQSKY